MLTVSAEPAEGGNITLDPLGETYFEGTTVTLTANPASGYEFDCWSGDASGTGLSASLTMDSDKTATAHFRVLPCYHLTVSADPPGAGTFSLSPPGGTYYEGTAVIIEANPASGYEFDHWSGDVSGTSSSVAVTMDSEKNVVAHFTKIGAGGGEEELPWIWISAGLVVIVIAIVAAMVIRRR